MIDVSSNRGPRKYAGTAGDVSAGQPVLRLAEVAKSFGATQALVSASLELRPGEFHCVVGENGSGKSTLVKVLAGVHRPDSGQLEIGGDLTHGFSSPQDALQAGVATVFQEVLVVEPRSILENVWLGFEGLTRTSISEKERISRASTVLSELFGQAVDLTLPVEALSLSERQTCSIARALVRDPRVLILDEATSALDVETRDRLFLLLRRRVDEGAAVIFISHRMDEITLLADRSTVMRAGTTVATVGKQEATPDRLVELMGGAEAAAVRPHAPEGRIGPALIETRNLSLAAGADPIDFDLRSGELVGLAGLEGHGQDDFIKALAGIGPATGSVTVDGTVISSLAGAVAAGVVYVPRDRRSESLFESKSIRENFGLPTLGRDLKCGLITSSLTTERLEHWAERLRLKPGNREDAITTLSGGNQQKVVIARWLASEPKVLLLNDPTRGIDIGAKRDVYSLLAELADSGVAVVMLSTELQEHVELMDRVLVFRERQVAQELTVSEITRGSLLAAFFGTKGQRAESVA